MCLCWIYMYFVNFMLMFGLWWIFMTWFSNRLFLDFAWERLSVCIRGVGMDAGSPKLSKASVILQDISRRKFTKQQFTNIKLKKTVWCGQTRMIPKSTWKCQHHKSSHEHTTSEHISDRVMICGPAEEKLTHCICKSLRWQNHSCKRSIHTDNYRRFYSQWLTISEAKTMMSQ